MVDYVQLLRQTIYLEFYDSVKISPIYQNKICLITHIVSFEVPKKIVHWLLSRKFYDTQFEFF